MNREKVEKLVDRILNHKGIIDNGEYIILSRIRQSTSKLGYKIYKTLEPLDNEEIKELLKILLEKTDWDEFTHSIRFLNNADPRAQKVLVVSYI